jgi:predicted amidophosphoribosyltransferase
MKKYTRKDCKKDDMEIAYVCGYCYKEIDKEDNFCRYCGKEFKISDPVEYIKDGVDLFKLGYKKGYNDAKEHMIRLLSKEVK